MSTTVVKEIGGLVSSFEEEKIVILFGPQAPQELKDISVIHEFKELTEEPLKENGTIQIDDQTFTITAVGNQANANFKELGHVSIYFQEPLENVLPGAVFAKPYKFPVFQEGTVITFNS